MNENLNRVSFHSLKEKQSSRNTVQLQNENDQFRPINLLGPSLSSAPRGGDPPCNIGIYVGGGDLYIQPLIHTLGSWVNFFMKGLQLLMY